MSKNFPKLFIIGGILLVLIGAFYTIGLLPQLDTSRGRFTVELLGLLVLGLVPLVLGLFGIWYGKSQITQARQAEKAKRGAELENKILQLAKANPRGLTSGEYAANTSFSLQEVEEKLGNLYVHGVLDMEVTVEGEIVYKLRALP